MYAYFHDSSMGFSPPVCSADGTTYIVPDDYPTIQQAIDVAEDGDIIEAKSGVYYESIYIDKQLTLVGSGTVEINAGGAYYGFELRVDGITIENFMVTHCGSGGNKAAIRILSNGNTVKDCIIQNNDNFGLLLYKNASGNQIEALTVSNNYYGIYLESADSNSISECTLFNNNLYGINVKYSDSNMIKYNSISDENIGIFLWESYQNILKDNTVSTCKLHGIDLRNSNDNTIYNNYLDNLKNGYDKGRNNWFVELTQDTNILGGPYLCGNYWSDYPGNDLDENGIGDTSYSIAGAGNYDMYPLFYQPNYAPYLPYDPTPNDASGPTERSITISWDCTDPEADVLSYDIYLDTISPPVQYIGSVNEKTYQIDNLDYSQVYYWQIVAHDVTLWNHTTNGPIWSFTTESAPQEPSSGASTSGGGGGGHSTFHNFPPVAEITVDTYQAYINEYFHFDASASNDPDGSIENYYWELGDGSQQQGKTISHEYNDIGEYTVTLTVKDNYGLTSKETVHITVIKANTPPEAPNVMGPVTGSVGTEYTYNVIGIDLDDDNIQYIVNWDDSTTDQSLFLPNATSYSFNHIWTNPGVFTISFKSTDNETESSTESLQILIDAIYAGDYGYLIDTTQNGVYDSYYSNNTGIETDVQTQQDDVYLIDDDGDGTWDYTFYTATQQVDVYQEPIPEDENNNTMMLLSVGLIAAIVVLVLIALLNQKRRKN